jgi:hypothetical protein
MLCLSANEETDMTTIQAAINTIQNNNNILYFYTSCEDGRSRPFPHIHPKTLQKLINNKILVRRPDQFKYYDLKVGA